MEGELSQNWVCRSSPPGALKQQVLETVVVFWQLVCGLEHVGGEPPNVLLDEVSSNGKYDMTDLDKVRRDGTREDMMLGIGQRSKVGKERRGRTLLSTPSCSTSCEAMSWAWRPSCRLPVRVRIYRSRLETMQLIGMAKMDG